jgi:hypothetical protein
MLNKPVLVVPDDLSSFLVIGEFKQAKLVFLLLHCLHASLLTSVLVEKAFLNMLVEV